MAGKKRLKSKFNRSVKGIEKEFVHANRKLKYAIMGISALLIIAFVAAFFYINSTDVCRSVAPGNERDNCYQENAESSNNYRLCGRIEDEDFRQGCYAVFSDSMNSVSFCNRIRGDSKDLCLKNVAENNKDEKICPTISNEFWRNSCFKSLSIIKSNFDICKEIDGKYELRDACYFDAALANNQTRGCRRIMDETMQGRCNLELAQSLNNMSLCNLTVLSSYKGMCYSDFALKLNDSSVCNNIEADIIKERCLGYFGLGNFSKYEIEPYSDKENYSEIIQ